MKSRQGRILIILSLLILGSIWLVGIGLYYNNQLSCNNNNKAPDSNYFIDYYNAEMEAANKLANEFFRKQGGLR